MSLLTKKFLMVRETIRVISWVFILLDEYYSEIGFVRFVSETGNEAASNRHPRFAITKRGPEGK